VEPSPTVVKVGLDVSNSHSVKTIVPSIDSISIRVVVGVIACAVKVGSVASTVAVTSVPPPRTVPTSSSCSTNS